MWFKIPIIFSKHIIIFKIAVGLELHWKLTVVYSRCGITHVVQIALLKCPFKMYVNSRDIRNWQFTCTTGSQRPLRPQNRRPWTQLQLPPILLKQNDINTHEVIHLLLHAVVTSVSTLSCGNEMVARFQLLELESEVNEKNPVLTSWICDWMSYELEMCVNVRLRFSKSLAG